MNGEFLCPYCCTMRPWAGSAVREEDETIDSTYLGRVIVPYRQHVSLRRAVGIGAVLPYRSDL